MHIALVFVAPSIPIGNIGINRCVIPFFGDGRIPFIGALILITSITAVLSPYCAEIWHRFLRQGDRLSKREFLVTFYAALNVFPNV